MLTNGDTPRTGPDPWTDGLLMATTPEVVDACNKVSLALLEKIKECVDIDGESSPERVLNY